MVVGTQASTNTSAKCQGTHAEQSKGSRLAQRRLGREEKLGDQEGAGPKCGDGDCGGQRLCSHREQLPKKHTKDWGHTLDMTDSQKGCQNYTYYIQ